MFSGWKLGAGLKVCPRRRNFFFSLTGASFSFFSTGMSVEDGVLAPEEGKEGSSLAFSMAPMEEVERRKAEKIKLIENFILWRVIIFNNESYHVDPKEQHPKKGRFSCDCLLNLFPILNSPKNPFR